MSKLMFVVVGFLLSASTANAAPPSLWTGQDKDGDGYDDAWQVRAPGSSTWVSARVVPPSAINEGWRGGSVIDANTQPYPGSYYPRIGDGRWSDASGLTTVGTYTYRVYFDLAGMDHYEIFGEWNADNALTAARINGRNVPALAPGFPVIASASGVAPYLSNRGVMYTSGEYAQNFRMIHPVMVTDQSLFLFGQVNVLELDVYNQGSATALLFTGGAGTYTGSFNAPPTADAGLDRAIRAGDVVQLDGRASFDDNTPSASLVYQWTFDTLPAGSTAVLSGASTSTPSFVADLAATYVLELVVTDEAGASSAPAYVTVAAENLAPVADAGLDRIVIVGVPFTLDGSASTDPEGDLLTWSWTIDAAPIGSVAVLADPATDEPVLVPDLAGDYRIFLEVSDFLGPSELVSVTLHAVSASDYTKLLIQEAADIVTGLERDQVTTKGNQNAFVRDYLIHALTAIDAGHPAQAINKLADAIARTDGCALRGGPDIAGGADRDWVLDCSAQREIHERLLEALDLLQP